MWCVLDEVARTPGDVAITFKQLGAPCRMPYDLGGKKVWDMLYVGANRTIVDDDVVPKQLISLL